MVDIFCPSQTDGTFYFQSMLRLMATFIISPRH